MEIESRPLRYIDTPPAESRNTVNTSKKITKKVRKSNKRIIELNLLDYLVEPVYYRCIPSLYTHYSVFLNIIEIP